MHAERISIYEHALALDPQSVEAQSLLAAALMDRVFDGATDSSAADLVHAEKLVAQALATSPRYAPAHFANGARTADATRPFPNTRRCSQLIATRQLC